MDDVSIDRVQMNAAAVNYRPRIVGSLLFSVMLGTIPDDHHPEFRWSLVAFSLIWPHIAYWIGNQAEGSIRSEKAIVLAECILGGLIAAALSFRLWPTTTMFVIGFVNLFLFGGGPLALRGVALFGLGALAATLSLGVRPHWDTEPIPTVISIIGIVAYAGFIGATAYGLRQRQRDAKRALEREELKSYELLLNVFPRAILPRLKAGESPIADQFADVTVLFVDIVDYTPLSERLGPKRTVMLLNDLYRRFDRAATQFGVEKIETAGDGYLAVGGAPESLENHPLAVARLALAMVEASRKVTLSDSEHVEIRVGVHTGPVFGGVIGEYRFHYAIFGETVNIASRIQSQSRPGRVLLSESTYKRIRTTCSIEECGTLDLKGHGPLRTYWLLESDVQLQPNGLGR